ncbi:MAG: class I SAM-dependent methyltransferase [Acidobacteria bacterium]|nr:class I SAM-dependent methyltransferase [Acidobacteriota bacterium]
MAKDQGISSMTTEMRAAASAFDAIAPRFDERFGAWLSVAAQRKAVRSALIETFPKGGRVLEIGGGTGEDAAFLARSGYEVILTDASPVMVEHARAKLRPLGGRAEVTPAEDLEHFAECWMSEAEEPLDGAFSNFAPLNCVVDLEPVARGLARLLRQGSSAVLVVFGTFCPGEMITESLRLRFKEVLRRTRRGPIKARIGQREFEIVYHRRAELTAVFAPWFSLEKTIGIGVAVPPSGAEPWISGHPGLLASLEAADRVLARPLSMLGDHVLYHFRRNEAQSPKTIE